MQETIGAEQLFTLANELEIQKQEDFKMLFFKTYLPQIKRNEIDEYMVILPIKYEKIAPIVADWLKFDEHCHVAVAVNKEKSWNTH